MLKRHFKDVSIDLEKYLALCEQLNQEPDPEKMPPSLDNYPPEVQSAFFIHSMLPDRWDGASGSYFGKDWAPILSLLDIYQIENKSEVTTWVKQIERFHSEMLNEKAKQQRDATMRKMKASSGGTSKPPRIKR